MGRKGVSKRKIPKVKQPTVPGGNSHSPVSNIMRVSESPAAKVLEKGEAISTGKGGKKK